MSGFDEIKSPFLRKSSSGAVSTTIRSLAS